MPAVPEHSKAGRLTAEPQASGFDQLVDRLAADSALVLPPRAQRECKDGGTSVSTKAQYLQQLVHKDPSILLERHGHLLTQPELQAFEPLSQDYEVHFYLQKLLTSKPSQACVKNRRHAKLQRLLEEGTFFSDQAMRARQPLLFHEYLGQYTYFQAPQQSKLSESLLQQHDELQAQEQLRQAQAEAQAQVQEPAFVHEEETDSGSEPEPVPSKEVPSLSAAQLQDQQAELIEVMKACFLDGSDPEADYAAIDNDSSLDDDNPEHEQDLQERHFEYDFDNE